MKAGAFVLALLWFGAAVYAGYRLTERSFVWIGQPSFGLVQKRANVPKNAPINLDALKTRVPSQILDQAAKLSPQQLLCLQAAIAPARVQAVLNGQMTAQEAAAVKTCLQ